MKTTVRVIDMNNDKGFTLIEILLAVTILFVVLLAFTQFFITSQKGTIESQEKLEATNIAQLVFEKIKDREGSYSEITGPGNYGCNGPSSDCTLEKYVFHVNEHEFRVQVQVSELVDSTEDLYWVEVIVTYSGVEKSSVKGLIKL